MRIGLLRHFPVDQPWPTGWRTAQELHDWLERYDRAEVLPGDFSLGDVDWRVCLSSDMPRAEATARVVTRCEIQFSPLLREPAFSGFPTGNLRLPVWGWVLVYRACWWSGHKSQRACRDDFLQRVQSAADWVCAQREDTLVVSHAGMMSALARELKRRGFRGPRFRTARHARAYVFERG